MHVLLRTAKLQGSGNMGGKSSKIRRRITWRKKQEELEEVTFDPLPEPEAPKPMDPRLPLDARQVFRIKKSWKGIRRAMAPAGLELFLRYITVEDSPPGPFT